MFLKIFPKKIDFLLNKHRKHVQDILKANSCNKFQLDISENG